MYAAFPREPAPMPRTQSIRLREAAPTRLLHEAKVIDAEFQLVDRKRRAPGMTWLIAALWAALIGLLIPPVWIFFEGIGALFVGS